jgi:hypothetical protein
VAPLQALEVGKLRKRIGDFDKKQSDFRDNFKTIRFFKFPCRRPYHYLQMSNDMIDQMEADMKTLQARISFYTIHCISRIQSFFHPFRTILQHVKHFHF